MKLQDLVDQASRDLKDAGVPAGRVRRALQSLRAHLPDTDDVEGMSVYADAGRVVVADRAARWEPDSGQILMDFGGESKADAGEPAELPPPVSQPPAIIDVTELAALAAERSRRQRAEAASRRHVSTFAASAAEESTAGQWFDQACELEAESRAEAIQAYHRALELDPGMTDAHVNLGRLYHDGRDPARAEAHYRAAILSAAQDPLPWFNLGVLLEDLRRIPEAVEAYERAIALDPEHGDAHYNLALLLESLGRKGAALKHLMKARRLSGPPDRS